MFVLTMNGEMRVFDGFEDITGEVQQNGYQEQTQIEESPREEQPVIETDSFIDKLLQGDSDGF